MGLLSNIENGFRAKLGKTSVDSSIQKSPQQPINEMPDANKTDAGTYSGTGTIHVLLDNVGDRKIAVIKVIREYCGLGLAEAKDLVESAPCAVYEGMSAERAQQLSDALMSVGAIAQVI